MKRALLLSALVTVVACGCGSTTASSVPTSAGWPSSFVDVSYSAPVFSGDEMIRDRELRLEVRSATTGALRRVLLQTLGSVDAAVASDGSLVVAVDDECRTVIERIDAANGRTTPLRTLPGSIGSIALNPTGTELAYLTDAGPPPRACAPTTQPASPQPGHSDPGGAMGSLPTVLGIVNLVSGGTRTTPTGQPGHAVSRPTWSPDGSQIAVGDDGNGSAILVMSATNPDYGTARRLSARPGCWLSGATWALAGIIAAEGCGRSDGLSPDRLVQLGTAGQIVNAWHLPACIAGVSSYTDSSRTHVLIQANVGYGVGKPCGAPVTGSQTAVISTINGSKLRTLAEFQRYGPPPSFDYATGW